MVFDVKLDLISGIKSPQNPILGPHQRQGESKAQPLDALGIGAGPSNLSLAALCNPLKDVSIRCFEKKASYAWHGGQLLDNAKLQISFLKDLVTPVDPTNPYSFLNYLKCHGRMYLFFNAGYKRVLRREFGQYLKWVSEKLDAITLGESIREITFDECFKVRSDSRIYYAKSIVFGVGIAPKIPEFAKQALTHKTVFNVCDFLDNAGMHYPAPATVAVLGGGQSGAEIILHLLQRRDPSLQSLIWITRRGNFFPLDESPFVNELFSPDYSEYFYSLPEQQRKDLLTKQKLASDGISASTLEEIYQAIYENNFLNDRRIEIKLVSSTEILGLSCTSNGPHRLTGLSQPENQPIEIECDQVILCTGFKSMAPELIANLCPDLDIDCQAINENYELAWDGPGERKIFVQNSSPLHHGIADANLSLMAWRAAKIANQIAGRQVYNLSERKPFRCMDAQGEMIGKKNVNSVVA